MIIDGVFSGGGIKGFAMVGALQVLEDRGFVMNQTAGTSAGSIVAALIAAGYSGKDIQRLLSTVNMTHLLDKRNFLKIPFAEWLLLYWKLGLYKGEALEHWVSEMLAKKGLVTFGDIPPQSLRIITSDITNGRLVVLPDDLPKYGINPQSFPIAKAVRMSCSIPYFFEPVKLRIDKVDTLFVDGGVLSNFPMWLFESEHIRKVRPVIGLKFTSDADLDRVGTIDNAIEMFGALFKTMKDAHDSRHISKKLAKNIMFIPMKDISGTDFMLTEERKEELIERGRVFAYTFLKTWTY